MSVPFVFLPARATIPCGPVRIGSSKSSANMFSPESEVVNRAAESVDRMRVLHRRCRAKLAKVAKGTGTRNLTADYADSADKLRLQHPNLAPEQQRCDGAQIGWFPLFPIFCKGMGEIAVRTERATTNGGVPWVGDTVSRALPGLREWKSGRGRRGRSGRANWRVGDRAKAGRCW